MKACRVSTNWPGFPPAACAGAFSTATVPQDLLRLVCACALSAPSKSDLQQGDILIVRENDRRAAIADLLPAMPWLREAPVFLVFLANGRRLPRIAQMRGKPFPNDHLDLFFNATVDAAIVLATFLRAADAVGLGCCPISVIRDHARAVSDLLALPDKVVPIAGMCVGWPAEEGGISPRLSLATTLHEERFDEGDLAAQVDVYDHRRAALRPYRNQRDVARFGRARFLRLVRGQGAAIRGAAARGFRRLRARPGLSSRLNTSYR